MVDSAPLAELGELSCVGAALVAHSHATFTQTVPLRRLGSPLLAALDGAGRVRCSGGRSIGPGAARRPARAVQVQPAARFSCALQGAGGQRDAAHAASSARPGGLPLPQLRRGGLRRRPM